MGALYYPQSAPDLTLTMTPLGTTNFPPTGGLLEYNIAAQNNGTSTEIVDIWVDVSLPTGGLYGPVLGPVSDFTMAGGFSADRDRELTVPGAAPPGPYSLNGYLGEYDPVSPIIYAEDSFNFNKASFGDGGEWISNWFVDSGESFEELAETVNSVEVYGLIQCYPNPFNPETQLNFSLPENGEISLIVYDIQGREVATLYDGWYQAGSHKATFSGAALPTGVYFARLTAGSVQQTQKLVLMK
ncbi:hypothetical protein CEE37_13090 [candidate division LCP-89 bacterium B3_LCP]|uniref:Secretion system C-terminal sorting domain-containing protein n=1 Tax=candidate division LCP-89 bacterium B3_LCP TaxID=2012998 RepID=A0A532UUJ2_UNCL8|nr:MAG: hypothetical protein CEE37_13090 [candidate division LCP-89 bacterium B3_LCP]